jgi:hypothetical protein
MAGRFQDGPQRADATIGVRWFKLDLHVPLTYGKGMEASTVRDQGMPPTFGNAPRVARDGRVFIERHAAMALLEELRAADRELLDRLAGE